MRKRNNPRGNRSKPQKLKVVFKIMPGEKLLWQKSKTDFGHDLNIVDASVQEN